MSVLPALQRLVPKPGTSYAAAMRQMTIDLRAAEIRRFVREECKGINYSVGQRLRRMREAREDRYVDLVHELNVPIKVAATGIEPTVFASMMAPAEYGMTPGMPPQASLIMFRRWERKDE